MKYSATSGNKGPPENKAFFKLFIGKLLISAFSIIIFKKSGIPTYPVVFISDIISACISEFSPPAGKIVHFKSFAASSNIIPAGVK